MVGAACDSCSRGAYHLHEKAPEGCLKCFCFGVTDQCRSSSWYRTKVSSLFLKSIQCSLWFTIPCLKPPNWNFFPIRAWLACFLSYWIVREVYVEILSLMLHSVIIVSPCIKQSLPYCWTNARRKVCLYQLLLYKVYGKCVTSRACNRLIKWIYADVSTNRLILCALCRVSAV